MPKERGFDFKFNVEYAHLNDTWSSNDLEQIKVQDSIFFKLAKLGH